MRAMEDFPYIQALHQRTLRSMDVPSDNKLWPRSWKVVEFKEYPRMPQIKLLPPTDILENFSTVLHRRSSTRTFSQADILPQEISNLLFWSAGIRTNKEHPEMSQRFYPSGGARFPLEIYTSFKGNSEIPRGVYHYNVKNHTLERLLDASGEHKLRTFKNYSWVEDAPLLIFITAIFERSMRKYKERGYRFTLIETGELLQNLYLVSTAMKLECCAVGTIIDSEVEKLLDINSSHEFMLVHAAFGRASI